MKNSDQVTTEIARFCIENGESQITNIQKDITQFSADELPVDEKINSIVPAIRMLLSNNKIMVAKVKNNKSIDYFATSSEMAAQVSFLQLLYIETQGSEEQIIEEFSTKLNLFKQAYSTFPRFILIKQIGLIAIGETILLANSLLETAENLLKICYLNINNKSRYKIIDEKVKLFLEKTESETTLSQTGRIQNKIVIITGAAQGFGGGLAEEMFANGANIVIADLNEAKAREFANELNKKAKNNFAHFVKTDVSNPESVKNLIFETVKEFGGLDVFISNAGILFAGGIDEMTPEKFELVTKVNYNGYFICTKYASEIFKTQSKYKKNYFTDIIQINSKSGLRGSKKNFAYAGGKFGGIGLTQSFALELIEYNIKVNSICPGNFFDGPLWSDPNNGLFVQYLIAGKVPGAKNIEDVKRFYENQVPARRGCNVTDVLRAVYYVIEQEYETGQAIPVTGGQVMIN